MKVTERGMNNSDEEIWVMFKQTYYWAVEIGTAARRQGVGTLHIRQRN